MVDMSKGGESMDQARVVRLPRIESIQPMATFNEDAPHAGMWIWSRCIMSIFM